MLQANQGFILLLKDESSLKIAPSSHDDLPVESVTETQPLRYSIFITSRDLAMRWLDS